MKVIGLSLVHSDLAGRLTIKIAVGENEFNRVLQQPTPEAVKQPADVGS